MRLGYLRGLYLNHLKTKCLKLRCKCVMVDSPALGLKQNFKKLFSFNYFLNFNSFVLHLIFILFTKIVLK